MTIDRRRVLQGLGAGLAATMIGRDAAAQEKTIRVAVLKVVGNAHALFYERFAPPGYKFQLTYMNTPTDAKDAVATGSADFALGGVVAAILGSSNREPIVLVSNLTGGSMAVIARSDGPIKTIADLKGKRVGLQPGSTQDLVIAERLKQEKMTPRDIQVVRIGLGEMHAALSRGDVDAYVGTEPGSSLSLMEGVGRLVEHPYGTPTGDLVTAMMANANLVRDNPALVRDFVLTHARATEFLKANLDAWEDAGAKAFGLRREVFRVAIKNINTEWRMDQTFVARVDAFAKLMLENKMIRRLPENDFVVTRFVEDLAKTGI
jgi:ABC-type nitrate/sulfonate/bicarbonate transport system substrate-binding protein